MSNDSNTKEDLKPKTGSRNTFKRKFRKSNKPAEKEFEQKILDLARVTRVTAGGKRMRFRACVIISDKKRVGLGVAKGADVTDAINKAVIQAKKNLIEVEPFQNRIPHEINVKFKAAKVFLKPGRLGDGIIAGGVVRNILEMGGFGDIVAKMSGSGNKINNAKALMKGIQSFVVIPKKSVSKSKNK